MERFLTVLKSFKDILWVVIVVVLLVVLQFKNGAIKRLREKVSEQPKVEYIYQTKTDTIVDVIVEPREIVKWKEKIVIETDSIPLELSKADSAQIAEAYSTIYAKYNETNIYKDTLKDDSLAFIQLNEKVTRNSIFDRELIYQDRTPIIRITNTVQDKTLSLVGGVGANIGKETNTLSLGLGVVAPSNRVYMFNYDPVNKGFGGAIYLPIFNIKR